MPRPSLNRRAFVTTLLSALFGGLVAKLRPKPWIDYAAVNRSLFNPQADLARQYRQGGSMIRMVTTYQREYNQLTSAQLDVLYGWSADVSVGPSVTMPSVAVGDMLTVAGRNLVNAPPADPPAFTPTHITREFRTIQVQPGEALAFHRDAFTLVWG